MNKSRHRIALAASVLAFCLFGFGLGEIFERMGLPIFLDPPTTRLNLDSEEHRFVEEVVDYSRSTGVGDVLLILPLVFSRVVYKLIASRTPMSRREKRWLIYVTVGFSVWTLAGELLRAPTDLASGSLMLWTIGGEWLDTPLDSRVVTYVVLKGLHLLIGLGIIGICRWDYIRTFPPTNQPPPLIPSSQDSQGIDSKILTR